MTGEGRHSLIERPLQNQFPLEMSELEDGKVPERCPYFYGCPCETIDRHDEPDTLVRPRRPKQFAASNADLIRRLWPGSNVAFYWCRIQLLNLMHVKCDV